MDKDFVAPGPGHWALDRSHYPDGATPISQWLLTDGFRVGFTRVFAELGIPAERIDIAFVHGFMYTRLRPLIGPDKPPRRNPPTFVLKAATRLHPLFRERNKLAIASLRDRPAIDVVRRWETEIRPELHAKNVAFQAFDPHSANDVELQTHVNELLDQLRENFVLHFWLHGHDLGPLAKYLHNCLRWGLDVDQAIEALSGASPSTSRPLEALCRLRAIVDDSGNTVTSLDALRAVSTEADNMLTEYLGERGHVLATGYDLDSPTLVELPSLLLDSILSASAPPIHNFEELAGELRALVPSEERSEFDQNLADARNVMDMRDDNGPVTVEWPMGLMRRALKVAGARLVERAELAVVDDVFELTPDEARALFAATLPSAAELSARAERRRLQSALTAPATLGPVEPEPPLDALPPALARLIAMTQVAIKYMGDDTKAVDGLRGAGIGKEVYVGTARVANSAHEAFERLEPGDVLVVRATSPAFNAVLAIAGAVVTANGGVLSHAAVLSRELGIPAVIGATGALGIPDGSTVEVDPIAGRVRVLPEP